MVASHTESAMPFQTQMKSMIFKRVFAAGHKYRLLHSLEGGQDKTESCRIALPGRLELMRLSCFSVKILTSFCQYPYRGPVSSEQQVVRDDNGNENWVRFCLILPGFGNQTDTPYRHHFQWPNVQTYPWLYFLSSNLAHVGRSSRAEMCVL